MSDWNKFCKTLIQNKSHTVGIVKVSDEGKTKLRRIVGYWNKELLMEIVEVLNTFEYRDFEMSFIEDEEVGASMLLMKSPKLKDDMIYIAVAGKTDVETYE